jgi:L-lactate dehydrogenase complex protein LldG
MKTARDAILHAIRSRKAAALPKPAAYRQKPTGDLVERFTMRARAADATVEMLDGFEDVPECVAGLLRARNLAAKVCLPPASQLRAFGLEQKLSISTAAPGPDDTAIAMAAFGVAETGTLVYPSSAARPASWHFRPGFEIAVLRADDIVADLEAVLPALRRNWPATLNLVTGPSRTADIEQTLELGAHGPKALAVLLVGARPKG